jgi:hypothetical protein
MRSSAEPSSWADLVNAVDRQRKHLPWDPSEVQPVQRVSLYQVSLTRFLFFCLCSFARREKDKKEILILLQWNIVIQ